MKASFRNCRACLAIGFLLALSGCVELDDVAGLGKIADQMRSSLPPVVADIPASCERQNSLVMDIPANERGPLAATDCAPYKDLAEHISKDQSILIAYLDALSKLASNAPSGYDTAIAANITTTGAFTGISPHAAAASSAAQQLASAIADAATHAYREKKVNELILAADPSVQELTSTLSQVITVDFNQVLSNEGKRLGSFYDGPIAASKGERLSLILVQRQYEGDKAALATRVAAVQAYGKVMDNLASTHAKLAAAAKAHTPLQQVAKDIAPNVASLKAAISNLVAQEK
jgi:hypothetical protein